MGTPVRLLIADDSATVRRAICALLQAQTDIAVCGEAGNYAELLKQPVLRTCGRYRCSRSYS